MAKHIDIQGTVSWQDLGTGFWGITDQKGNDWRPVDMPEQLKVRGAHVQCTIEKVQEEVSVFMWGTPVRIIAFRTPGVGSAH